MIATAMSSAMTTITTPVRFRFTGGARLIRGATTMVPSSIGMSNSAIGAPGGAGGG